MIFSPKGRTCEILPSVIQEKGVKNSALTLDPDGYLDEMTKSAKLLAAGMQSVGINVMAKEL